jgi:transcriptional regulator with XRE-family HTH domain
MSSIISIIYTDNHTTHTMPKIIESDDIPGIQRLIQRLSAAEGISIYVLAERSGLHPTTLYSILKKKPSATRRPVRRETIRALAEGNRYTVTFDAVKKRVILEPSEVPAPRTDVEELLEGLRGVLMRSKRREFTEDMKERILGVVKVLSQ